MKTRQFLVVGLAFLAHSICFGADLSPTKALDGAVKSYASFDRDQDGTLEIRSLQRVKSLDSRSKKPPYMLVLVERRLIDGIKPALKTLAKDIAREGSSAFIVSTEFYDGPAHQDGLTLIAYRDFFRQLWLNAPGFQGVILVGNFPQPFMVRQYAWKRDDPVTLFAGTKAEKSFKQPWFRNVAEPVVSPSDIVLADLDGAWDARYFKQPVNVAEINAVFPEKSDVTEDWETSSTRYQDFFFVNDGPWTERHSGGHKMQLVFNPEPNDECTAADRKMANVIARPDISVSRINAYHAGVIPDPKVKGVDGKGLLDAAGKPQTVEFASAKDVPRAMQLWVHSDALEVKLLNAYFARNHAYRTQTNSLSLLPASVSTGLGEGISEMKANVPGWSKLDPSSKEYLQGFPSITELTQWFRKPAMVREIRAHSNPVLSEFGGPKSVEELEKETGPAYYWTQEGAKLVPTLKGIGGVLGFGFLRTVYENHKLPAQPVLYVHTGCEAMRPIGAEDLPFNAPDFAKWQLAECLMMYGEGLTVIGRGKVFYDEPRDFWKTMGAGGSWGDAWKAYFEAEARDGEVAKDGIGRKRTYFWSILGDFTLRLPDSLLKPAK
jgi:hypothetical protein